MSFMNLQLLKKKPFLGICVGMQMLANDSEENGFHKGLGWIEGQYKTTSSEKFKNASYGLELVNPKKKK